MKRRPAEEDISSADALPRFTGRLRPLVDGVARIDATIQRKLLAGFVGGALLLVGMGVMSLVVIAQMDQRMQDLEVHAAHAERGRQMLYDVTAQSHYRAMTLLTQQPRYIDQLERRRDEFAELLDAAEAADTEETAALEEIRRANDRFQVASAEVTAVYEAGDLVRAETLHVNREHELSHVVEDKMTAYVARAQEDIAVAVSDFRADRQLLGTIVLVTSAVAVTAALFVGFLLSWSIILPVKKMEDALAHVTSGRFDRRVTLPNRDEFGQLAKDLNQTSARLETLFAQQRALAQRLTDTNASLVRASEAKSRFLASVSHELRTPMNAILGFTDALIAGVDGPLNSEQRDSLGWVQRGARDLLGLINEILDLSRIEAGKLTIEPAPFEPSELVTSVVAQHRSLAAQKGLSLEWRDVGAPAQVVLDPQRLRQVLSNLIGNALKFTERGGVVVEVGSGGPDRLVIAVHDTGPGIPVEEQGQIFEEFKVGSGDAAGTGLGLTISRRLARAMGGEVSLESVPGSGSTFRVELPTTYRPVVEGAVSRLPGMRTPGDRLLLSIDDDPAVAPLLEKVIAGSPFRVVPADASAAVEEAARLRPDAVLLDILMPGPTGQEVLHDLKRDPRTSDIPVVVVSVVDAGEVPEEADAFVSKPVEREALMHALDEWALVPEVRS